MYWGGRRGNPEGPENRYLLWSPAINNPAALPEIPAPLYS